MVLQILSQEGKEWNALCRMHFYRMKRIEISKIPFPNGRYSVRPHDRNSMCGVWQRKKPMTSDRFCSVMGLNCDDCSVVYALTSSGGGGKPG